MGKVLLHCCCAPCSVSCIEPLKEDGFEIVAFWYNPNIHPFKEYEARRNCMIEYAKAQEVQMIVKENYGLRDFVRNVADNIDARCVYCYENRLEETARAAAELGYKYFTSTLLASVYQNHEAIVKAGQRFAGKYSVEFLYKDFRSGFREGNNRARQYGMYMQKYCGCIFSEEVRYQKQILNDKEKFVI